MHIFDLHLCVKYDNIYNVVVHGLLHMNSKVQFYRLFQLKVVGVFICGKWGLIVLLYAMFRI